MNGERYECERCGYVLGSWDKKPRFVDEFVKDSINDVLDKIRTEIETDLSHFCFDDWGNETIEWKEVKAIIDKYKTESEG